MKFKKAIIGKVLKYRGVDMKKVRVEGDKIFVLADDGTAFVFYATGESLFYSDDANYLRDQARFKRSFKSHYVPA